MKKSRIARDVVVLAKWLEVFFCELAETLSVSGWERVLVQQLSLCGVPGLRGRCPSSVK